jgi:hypothetical protein
MSKIYVLHENSEWTIHLQHRLDELGLPYELWHLDQGLLDLSSEPPQGVFYNRISASSHTRDHLYAPEFTQAVIAWLERHDRIVINGTSALRLEVSKVNQYMALNKSGIETPKTFAAVGKKQIIEAANLLHMPSFITKHNRAGKGQGVQLFHSVQALQDYIDGPNFDPPVDGITLIQQYIESPQPFIIRHEFIAGKFLYGVKVDTSQGFELCPADACSIEDMFCPSDDVKTSVKAQFEILENYRPAFIDSYERFLKDNNIQIAAIEAIQDSNGISYAYDVNTNTNYNADAEKIVGQFGMLEIANYLAVKLQDS